MVPATQEAEVRGLLEPRKSKLQGAMTAPLQSSLGDRVRPCLKETKTTNKLDFKRKKIKNRSIYKTVKG